MTPEDAEEYTEMLGQMFAIGWRQIAWAHKQKIPKALGLTTERWVRERLGGYVKLSISERREAVAELTREDLSTRAIGAVLGVDHVTVMNDQAGENSPAEVSHQGISEHIGENSPDQESETPFKKTSPETVKRVNIVNQMSKHVIKTHEHLRSMLALIDELEHDAFAAFDHSFGELIEILQFMKIQLGERIHGN